MSNYADIAKLSAKELQQKVGTLKTEMFNAKFSKHTVGSEKPHTKRALKKEIARVLTAINSQKKSKKK